MASSFISNWETFGHVDPDAVFFNDGVLDSGIADELIGLISDPFEASLLSLDPLFAAPGNGTSGQISYETELLHTAAAGAFDSVDSHQHYSLPFTPHVIHPGGDAGDAWQLGSHPEFHSPKRRRICSDSPAIPVSAYPPPLASCWCGEFAAADQFIPPPPPPPPQQQQQQRLSPQSIAARERRKRISEKTNELGKLIPGGSRMNTAEMFQAAHRYVKFLQAQVGVLSLMGSIQLPEQVEQQLEVLVGSQAMQDKLSREGRCVVPKAIAEAFAKNEEVRSNHLVSRDLDRFIGSIK